MSLYTAHRPGSDRSSGPHRSDPLTRRVSHLEELPPSPREQEVYELVAQGARNKEIARALGISEQTVKNHIMTLMVKLNCTTRAQLIVRYYGGALYEPPPLILAHRKEQG